MKIPRRETRIETLLAQWNGGVLRGARKRLAGAVKVTKGHISRVLDGHQPAGEELMNKLAAQLGVKIDDLRALLALHGETTTQLGWRYEKELIARWIARCKEERRNPKEELEWLIRGYLDGQIGELKKRAQLPEFKEVEAAGDLHPNQRSASLRGRAFRQSPKRRSGTSR